MGIMGVMGDMGLGQSNPTSALQQSAVINQSAFGNRKSAIGILVPAL
jgi:hypothetical protein